MGGGGGAIIVCVLHPAAGFLPAIEEPEPIFRPAAFLASAAAGFPAILFGGGITMFTVKQAAKRLNCSPSLVYELCAKGRIRHARIGFGRGTIRITEEAIADFLKEAEVEQTVSSLPPLQHLTVPGSRRQSSQGVSEDAPAVP